VVLLQRDGVLASQVSHHPPTAAMFTEGRQWQSWQEFTMASKFRGKYLQIIPLGESRASSLATFTAANKKVEFVLRRFRFCSYQTATGRSCKTTHP